MPQKGLSMHKVREILRLRFEVGLPARQVARACKTSHTTVLEYERKAKEAGISWPLPEDDALLERALSEPKAAAAPTGKVMPGIAYLAEEMRKKGVTLALLWEEYYANNPEGYRYSQFCHHYGKEKKKLAVVMRQEHRAGEKLFTDYAGQTMGIVDPHTGEVRDAYIFVAALGASSYAYAEAVESMDTPSWISSHIRTFEYFGGVTQIVVPDNTKCAVIKPCRYEPKLNPAFDGCAAHYGTAIIPARVRKPRDKAKVEASVLLVERWILAALRNRTFFSLWELNTAIRELLEKLNTRKFKRIDASRRDLYEKLDRPALMPLPSSRYEFLEWKTATVNIDYHVAVEKHLYSVPHQLVGKQVDVRLSPTMVEILYCNKRIASHIRSSKAGAASTIPEHRPKSHQEYLEWTPSRIINWARNIGPNTASLVDKILSSKQHPEMSYRSCLGIIRLGKEYTPERLEAACWRALKINAPSYRSVKSILEGGLDQIPLEEEAPPQIAEHANIRGKEYYQNQEGGKTKC